MEHLVRILSLLIALFGMPGAHAGNVERMPGYCPFAGGCYLLTGQITRDDLRTLGAALSNAHASKQQISVRVNSVGGDFLAAIGLGRMMRLAQATVVGAQSDVCMSSCVMLLAGATFRGHAGRVGIHRPFRLTTAPISASDMQREFASWDAEARRFLEEVNVPSRLWEEMIRIPPEKVRILSSEELSALGLTGEDPVSEEITDSSNARNYGLSKIDYLQRKALSIRTCNPILQRGEFEAWRKCDESVKRTGR